MMNTSLTRGYRDWNTNLPRLTNYFVVCFHISELYACSFILPITITQDDLKLRYSDFFLKCPDNTRT